MALVLVLEGFAFAASWTAPTRLTIGRRPTGTVSSGTEVVIRGRLRSPRPACRGNKRIVLIKSGKGVVAKTRTNSWGKYRFDKWVLRTSRFRTKFRGTVRGIHPDIRTCLSSRSKWIRVGVV